MSPFKSLCVVAVVALSALVNGCAEPAVDAGEIPKLERVSSALTEHGIDGLRTVVVDGVVQVEIRSADNQHVSRIDYLSSDRSGAALQISHAGVRYQIVASPDSLEIKTDQGSTAVARYDAEGDAVVWDDPDSLRSAVAGPLALIAIVASELRIPGPWQGEGVAVTDQPRSRDRCSDAFWACSGSCRRQFSAFWDRITGNLTACLNSCGAGADACYGQNQARPSDR